VKVYITVTVNTGLYMICCSYAGVVVIGQQIIEALENGVSKYPVLEGRFPQVSGVSFGFDPTKLPGHRIDPRHVRIQGSYIELDKVVTTVCFSFGYFLWFLSCFRYLYAQIIYTTCFLTKLNNRKQIDFCLQKYRLCTKSYLADGKDGYDVFRYCQQLVNECCIRVGQLTCY